MTPGSRDEISVQLDAADLGDARPLGTLQRVRSGGRAAVSFSYAGTWLAARDSFALDPALRLFAGEQYAPDGGLPGIFTDAAPDRWGRTLLERREALAARREGRRARRLDDWDFLIGVNDATRTGALRLATPDGRFLDDAALAVPPLARLRELEQAAWELERGVFPGRADEERWLAVLLAPGSSLGGARPKASFAAEDGALWIAKFPSPGDRRDVGAWEHLLTGLAADASIDVAETRLLRLGGGHRTFCARRWDRAGARRRLYASAMTLAGKRDGDAASYLDVALAIADHGDPQAIGPDLEQLFRRVAFNLLAGNRDDHLRNHGFLRAGGGWRLAPAFDLNPAPEKPEHTLALDDAVRAPDPALLRETARFYRLSDTRAREIETEVRVALAPWRERARGLGLPADEVEGLAQAFAV